MITELNKWMLSKPALTKILEGNLRFRVDKNSIKVKPDGSISCFLHCPVQNCNHGNTVTYQAYSVGYKLKKQIGKKQNSAAPKWSTSSMHKHLINAHSNVENSETGSPESSQRENSQSRDDDTSQSRHDENSERGRNNENADENVRNNVNSQSGSDENSQSAENSPNENAENNENAESATENPSPSDDDSIRILGESVFEEIHTDSIGNLMQKHRNLLNGRKRKNVEDVSGISVKQSTSSNPISRPKRQKMKK